MRICGPYRGVLAIRNSTEGTVLSGTSWSLEACPEVSLRQSWVCMGWLSHAGATLHQPVLTGSLQTGVGRSNSDRLNSLGPNSYSPWVTCPLCIAVSPVPLVDCFIVALLPFYCGYFMQPALSLLLLSGLAWTCNVSFPGYTRQVSPDVTFGQRLLTGGRGRASNIWHQA